MAETKRLNLSLHPKQMEVYQDNHRFRVVAAGRRFGKCVAEGTLIKMSDGTEKRIEEVVSGDSVLSLNPKTYELESKRVVAIKRNGIRPVYEVFSNAHRVVVTQNHPFLSGAKWKEVKELKIGDLVAVPKFHNFGDLDMPDCDIVLLATWLAEGNHYVITNKTKEVLDEIFAAASHKGMWFLNERGDGLTWLAFYGEKETHVTLNPLRRLLEKYHLWSCTSKTKFIPDDIFRLPRAKLARFLNLFVACDGCITNRGESCYALEIGLANERMVRQLQSLFLKFGIRGQIGYKKHKARSSVTGEHFESWTFRTSDSEALKRFCVEIGAAAKENKVLEALFSALGSAGSCNRYLPISYDEFVPHARYDVTPFPKGNYGGFNCCFERGCNSKFRETMNSWRKQSRNRMSVRRYEQLRPFSDGFFDNFVDKDVAWEEIKAITPVGERQTYDIEVEDNHNFIADGFITHNSFLSRIEMIHAATKPNQKVWYVAPTYRMAKQIMWGDLLDALPREWIVRQNETNLSLELINGSRIELKGADKPDSLRGVGLDFLVLDEFQDFKEETWTRVLRPTLADKKGSALFIGCVSPTTKILTREGICKIGSLSKGSPDKTLDECNLDLYGLNHEFHKADGFWNNGVVPTKEITTSQGFYLEASYPHPVYTVDGWKKIEDIKVGDKVAIARGMEVWGNKDVLEGWDDYYREWKSKQRKTRWDNSKPEFKPVMNEDLAYFLGLWLAEGSIEKKVYRITITCGDSKDIGAFLKSGKVYGLKFKESPHRADQWRANSKDFVELMKFLGMPLTTAPNKFIPDFVWKMPRELAVHFVSGMIDGDGHVRKRETKPSIGYATSSGMLARDLQLLLSNFGVIAKKSYLLTMPTKRVKKLCSEFQLAVNGNDFQILKRILKLRVERKKANLENTISNGYSRKDYCPISKLILALREKAPKLRRRSFSEAERKVAQGREVVYNLAKRVLNDCSEYSYLQEYKDIQKVVEDNYYWDTVEEIRESKRLTYDFTIPDTHSFWSNGFISHNTPKGLNHFYRLYKLGQSGMSKNWKSWQFPTISSPFIPYAEIEAAKRDMDEKSFRQELMSSFESMSGRVYYPFDQGTHVKKCAFNSKLPIWIGMDFNIDPMSAVVMQPQPNGEVWVVSEVVQISSNTEEMCQELERRYYRWQDKVIIFPDPAGGARQHARGESDLDIMKEHGFTRIKYRRQHPPVADRVNAVNRMLMSAKGEVKLYVDPKCTHLITALEQTLYIENSREVDKSANIEHSADALGYAIEIMYPVRKVHVAGFSR